MINATARLAVNIRHLPESINWEDMEPQRSHQSLTIDDFLPSDRDGVVLQGHATRYVMEFLVSNFESLGDLKDFVPTRELLHPVKKSVVVPMKILFKYKVTRLKFYNNSWLMQTYKDFLRCVDIIIIIPKY